MLNKNIQFKPSSTSNSSFKGKAKLNTSLIMSPSVQAGQGGYHTPKRRVDVGFKSPNFGKSHRTDYPDRYPEVPTLNLAEKKPEDLFQGFENPRALWDSRPITENKGAPKNLNQSASTIKLSSKLK